MEDKLLSQMVNDMMQVYKRAFEEGRKAGDREGYLRGIIEVKAIVDKTFGGKK